jgi:signal transduction histidine kinase
VFNVRAANSDGVWSEPKSLAIYVPLPIWKQTWLYFLIALCAGGLGFAVHRQKVRTAIARAVEVERARREEEQRVRGEVKNDVHDTFAGIVSKISGLAKDMVYDIESGTEGAQQKLNKIVEYAESLIQGYAAIQWEYDSKKDTLFDLVAQLKQYGDTLYDKSNIKFYLAGDVVQTESIKLPNEWRKELLLLFYEAMNNIAKHAANASCVILSTSCKDGTIEMCLMDDGDGFDQEHCTRKNGLDHMRDRAARLNGELRVESGKEKGTKICFIGKLSSRRVGIFPASQ